jgi:hypothetical protein
MEYTIREILDSKLHYFRNKCPEDITDLVFLEIEKSYLLAYENAIKYKSRDTINKFIGKFIKQHWDLKNLGRCNNPKSRLISSYEKHCNY